MNGCQLIRPFVGEFYSYENGLEIHSSFKDNRDIERRFYRREPGAGASRKDSGILLVHEDIGLCFQFQHKTNYYQLIYQDKYSSLFSSIFLRCFENESQCSFQFYQIFNRTRNVIRIRKRIFI